MDQVRALVELDLPPQSAAARLLTGGTWAIAGKAISMAAALVLNGFVARILDPNAVGVYFLLLSVITIAGAIAGLGLKSAIVKVVAETQGLREGGKTRSAVLRSFALTLVSATLVAALMGTFGLEFLGERLFSTGEFERLAGVGALLVFSIAIVNLVTESLRGFHDIRMATITTSLANSLLPPLLLLGLVQVNRVPQVGGVLTAHLVAAFLAVAVGASVLTRRLRPLARGRPYPWTQLLRIGWPLMLVNIALILQPRIGLWITGTYLAASDTALYGASEKLSTLVITPLVLVNTVLPPIIAEMNALERKGQLESTLQTAAAIAFVPAFLVTAGFAVFGQTALALIFGPFYASASAALLIISVGQLVNVISGSCGLALMMTDRQREAMVIIVFGLLLQAALGVGLVGRFGIEGVAISVAAVLILQNGVMVIVARRRVGIWTHAWIRRHRLNELLKR